MVYHFTCALTFMVLVVSNTYINIYLLSTFTIIERFMTVLVRLILKLTLIMSVWKLSIFKCYVN